MTRALRFLLPAVVLGAVACQDEAITLSEGTNASLAVSVYVDADGDGAFSAASADVPVSGVTVAAGTQTQVSDASGVATFSLAPGSYTLSVTGDVPAGAVLATATNPILAVPFQGGSLTAEFRYSFLPGTLAGVIFRDDDLSGGFTSGTDTPAGGMGVTLLDGTDTVGTGVTAVDGTFSFATLRPGDYTLAVTPFPTVQLVDTTQTVTIAANAQTDLEIPFTGNLVVAVSDARTAADGATIAIEGVVSAQSFRTSLDAFMQDGTAGMTLFDFGQPAAVVGDSVRVVGRKDTRRGEVQIDSVFTFEVLAAVGEPATTVVTAADINAGSFQSMLVEIDGTVDSLTADFFDNARVFLTDGAGGTFVAESDSRNSVASTDWVVGQLYTVIGVLSSDDRDALQYRLEVRSLSDLILGGSAITLAAARDTSQFGQTVTVVGVLNWQAEWRTTRLEGFMQDATAGIALFDFGVDPTGLMRGDTIRVRGTVGAFRGELQIGSVDVFTVIAPGPPPTPRTVTAAEIDAVDADSTMFQGELVTIAGMVDSLLVFTSGSHFVFLTDGAGDTFTAFVDDDTGILPTSWTVGATVTLTGPLGFDNRNTPAERIEIRDPNDVQ